MNLLLLLCLTHFVVADQTKKINLEDIERDNLVSERKSQGKVELDAQQTQHYRPASVIGQQTSYEIQHESGGDSHHGGVSSSVTYSRPSPSEYETNQNNVQYVTISPVEDHPSKEYHQPTYTPVHEDSRTYAAPSRHSLVKPIQQMVSPTPSPYLAQQPQFVYVQATAPQYSNEVYNQIPENTITNQANQIRYASHSGNSAAITSSHQEEQSAAAVAYEQPSLDINYLNQNTQQETVVYPQPQYIHYVPYQAPLQQTYIMMVPLKDSHNAFVQQNPLIQYGDVAPQYIHQPIQYAIESDNSIQYSPQIPVLPYAHQPQSQAPIYSTQNQPIHHAAPSPIQIQQSVEYPAQRVVEYISRPSTGATTYRHSKPTSSSTHLTSSSVNALTHNTGPTLDFFGPHSKQYGSLLDSYIPSSLIVERQKSLFGRQHNSYASNHLPSTNYVTGGNHYNTIAYSSPHNYETTSLKRSPKQTNLIKVDKSVKTTKN